MIYSLIKNILDRFISLVSLITLSPLLLLISSLILIFEGRPIFFLQTRPGLKSKLFTIIKFRTMKLIKYSNSNKFISDEHRLTSLGKFLRKTSLDELPELINILKGEMSFIGPRPLLTEYLPLYSKKQLLRHNVLPGLSGWAQINGRNAISWEEKFNKDIWYVNNMNFILDLKIIFLTIWKVIKRESINAVNSSTAKKFTGNKLK